MEEIVERYSDGELGRLDGISIDYDDWHFNVRPSNTEPLLRLNLESLVSQDAHGAEARRGARADPRLDRRRPLRPRRRGRASTGSRSRRPFAVGRVNVYLIEDEPLTLVDAGPNSGTSLRRAPARHRRARPLARGHRAGDPHPPAHRPSRAGLAGGLALGRRGRRASTSRCRSWRTSRTRPRPTTTSPATSCCATASPRTWSPRCSRSRARSAPGARAWRSRAPLRDGEALELRDRTLHVHHRPGHTPTDTVFHDRDRRILIAADHLLGHISSNPLITRPRDGSDERPQALVHYLESLAATREMDVELVLPGHGDPITDHRALIDQRFALHRRRADKIHRLLAERPRSAYEIAQALWGNIAVTQAYLTLSEVLGHLDVLANEGRVQEAEREGVVGFRSARPEAAGSAGCAGDRVASASVSAETALERAEELAERLLPDRTPKRRMLVIVNPYATTVSDRLRNLVVYALQSRYSVEAIDTEKRDHATQIMPRGRPRGLRRGGRVRRRRHRQRGRQRAGRVGDAADRAAGRVDQRLGAHARDPQRRGRRDRAPAADGRRVPALPRGPGPRGRAPLRVRLGRRPGRLGGGARGSPPAAQGEVRQPGTTPTPPSTSSRATTSSGRPTCGCTPAGGRRRASR